MIATFKHELSMHFKGLTAYMLSALLLIITGMRMEELMEIRRLDFHAVLLSVGGIFTIIIPVLTMRVFAEERRQKTDQLLYSLPITMTDVVLGKYLAMMVVFLIPVLIICFYPLVLSSYGAINLKLSYSAILLFSLLGAALIAIGTFVSAMTENQMASAGVCFMVIFINSEIPYRISDIPGSAVSSMIICVVLALGVGVLAWKLTKNSTFGLAVDTVLVAGILGLFLLKEELFENLFVKLLKNVSFYQLFYDIQYGALDLGTVVYFLSIVGFFLFLTVQTLEKRRWSE